MRKLAVFASAFAVATLFCSYLLPGARTLWIPGVVLIAVAVMLRLLASQRVPACRIALLGLAAGWLWFSFYNWFVYLPASRYDGFEGSCTIRVTDYSQTLDSGGIRIEGKLDGIGIRLTCYDMEAPLLQPGDVIETEIRCTLASSLTGSESFASSGIFLLGYTTEKIHMIASDANSLRYLPVRVSKAVQDHMTNLFPEDVLPFMTALLLGDRTRLYTDEALISAMSDTGTSHVVAVSGMHISFLVAIIQLLFGKRKYALVLCIPLLLFYIAMVGAAPSVVRAGIMALFLIGAQLLMREYDPATAISASLFLLLLQNPYSIQNIGLQLSYAAIIGIHLFEPRFRRLLLRPIEKAPRHTKTGRMLYRFCKPVATSVSMSLAASVPTIPLVAVYFGYVSLIAPLVNLLILWAVSLCFTTGLICVLVGFISTTVGAAVALLPSLLVRYICAVVRLAARIPYASLYLHNRYIVFWLFLCYGVFALALRERELRQKPWILASVLTGSLLLGFALSVLERPGALTVTVLDVGQGQCIALFGPKQTVLVDCGGDRYEGAGNLATEFLRAQNRHTVDTLILTHFHEDHANGVTQLMQRLQVKRLMIPALEEYGQTGDEILSLAAQMGIAIQQVDCYTSWEEDGLVFCIYPPVGVGDENEQGLSLLCAAGDFELLITGDMSDVTEQVLLRRYAFPDIELLIAGHHGSRYASSEQLLETVMPEFAAISVGEGNSYGHPAPEMLARLDKAGVQVFRTDICGNICFKLNEVD